MYYSKPQAYRLFLSVEDSINEFENLFNSFLEDKDSMPPTLLRGQIRRLKRQLEKIDLTDFKPYLEMQKGTDYYPEFKERADQAIKKINSFEDKLYDASEESSPTPSSSEKPSPIEDIKNKYEFIKNEYGTSDLSVIIGELKKLDREIGKLDFEYLDEGEYDEMVSMRNEVASLLKRLIGVQKSEKYGPYLWEPVRELVSKYSGLSNDSKEERRTASIVDFIEKPERIDLWEPAIKRIINKKMTRKEFGTFWDAIRTAKKSEEKFESFSSYKVWANAIY